MDPDSCLEGDMKSFMSRTFELLKSGEAEMELNDSHKNVILVSGESGTGKTKFLNFLVGDNSKLVSIETEEGDYLLEDTGDAERCIITSDTISPKMMFDPETNTFFCDNNGWHDTRDESYEINGTYLIKRVVDHVENIKLIFTINHTSVKEGIHRHSFMKTVKHVFDFIKNIEKFRDSILLLVTKVDNRLEIIGLKEVYIDNNKIINGVATFLLGVKAKLEEELRSGSSNERQLHEFAIKFISLLLIKDLDQYTRIGIFRRPDKPGPLSEISLLQEEKKRLKCLIHEKILFSKKENQDFGYTLSETCKNKIFYLVEDINKIIKSCLSRINNEIKDHYAKMVEVVLTTIDSFADGISQKKDLREVSELSIHLKNGNCCLSHLIEDLRGVKDPEDLSPKITAVVDNLNIDISKNDLMLIEKMGKYFNFLQKVNDKQFSILPWYELFRDVVAYLSRVRIELQEEIDFVLPTICKQIESDWQQIAKLLQNQFDEKAKQLELEEVQEVLAHYTNVLLKMSAGLKETMSTTEILEITCDFTRDINISLPANNVLNTIQHDNQFLFLRTVSEQKDIIEPSTWRQSFESVVNHLNESKTWYRYLYNLHFALSKYEIQRDREKYNVVDIEDWGKPNKPQGIVVTKNNYEQFKTNLSFFNIVENDSVKYIALTELRLEELNHLLNVTLKHRANIQYVQPSIFIRADYISIKEISHHNSENNRNLSTALKSGEFKFLHIFALKKVFVDEDLLLPGVELSIISPEWEVIGTRKINLDGTDGESHFEAEAADGVDAGSNGDHGKPGLPGKPGGNFFGIGASFINAANLTVSVNGGNGGPGQNGGNGRDGEPGQSIGHLTNNDLPSLDAKGVERIKGFPCEKVPCGDSSNLECLLRFVGSFFQQIPLFNIISSQFIGNNSLYKVVGSPGQDGGKGGFGGIVGKGGNPGNILIFPENSGIKICANKGKEDMDLNGRSGISGKPGTNGRLKFAVLKNFSTPTSGQQLPVPDQPASTAGQQFPIPGQPAPTPSHRIPAPGQPAPVPDQPASTTGQQFPVPGQPASMPGQQFLIPDQPSSTPSHQIPAPGQPAPTPGQQIPTPGQSAPTSGQQLPISGLPLPFSSLQVSVPGLPLSLAALQLPTPGLPSPLPTLQVPIPGLNMSIPLTIPAMQRRPEWGHQFETPGEAVSTSVSDSCGLNSEGFKVPEPSNAISEPLKIVQEYKIYAEQNSKVRFKKTLLLDFIAFLNNDDKIKCLYSIAA